MKYIPILAFGLLSLSAFAQSAFTGKIVYNLRTPKEKTEASLIAFFGKDRLRLEFAENGQTVSKDYIIIALDEGVMITVDSVQKSYRMKKLRKERSAIMKNKTIAGYKTSPVKSQSGMSGLPGGFFGEAVFQVADDLYYPVPEGYQNNPELMMVQNGHVVLGAEIRPGNYLYDREYTAADSVDAEKDIITAEAVELVKQQMDSGLFQIPAGFALRHPDYYRDSVGTAMLDSLDSAVVVTPPQKPFKRKKPTQENKKTPSQKSPAYRRKNG